MSDSKKKTEDLPLDYIKAVIESYPAILAKYKALVQFELDARRKRELIEELRELEDKYNEPD